MTSKLISPATRMTRHSLKSESTARRHSLAPCVSLLESPEPPDSLRDERLSASDILKACNALKVPVPYSNHWSLIARGTPLRRKILRPADANMPTHTSINIIDSLESRKGRAPKPVRNTPQNSEGAQTIAGDRTNTLDAFGKLEMASHLIQEALFERPSLRVLQLDPMLRTLAEGLRVLSLTDSELDLSGLILKHEWSYGQSFYVRAICHKSTDHSFEVIAGQDVPEGVVIEATPRHTSLIDNGARVGLDIKLHRQGYGMPHWRIRAIDPE